MHKVQLILPAAQRMQPAPMRSGRMIVSTICRRRKCIARTGATAATHITSGMRIATMLTIVTQVARPRPNKLGPS